jgi:endonuclease/exonuclease/phosphatase family metal-dependent hydrolase
VWGNKIPSLSILTFNMQGLAASKRRQALHNFLHSDLHCLPDVFSFQEHKLREGHTDLLKSEIWRESHFITCPAKDGRLAAKNNRVKGGKGGVSLIIHPQLAPYIKEEGRLPSSRRAWAKIEHPRWGSLAFLAVYEPNGKTARKALWSEMAKELCHKTRWIICGYFNMMEFNSDHKGGAASTIQGGEKKAWLILKRKLRLEDSFHLKQGHLAFSWDSKAIGRHVAENQARLQPGRRLQRLDRVYSFDTKSAGKYQIHSLVLPGFNLSDHAPVLAELKVEEEVGR